MKSLVAMRCHGAVYVLQRVARGVARWRGATVGFATVAALALVGACGSDDVLDPDARLDPATVGAPCEAAAACGSGRWVCETSMPGGFCTVACSAEEQCPGETLCRSRGDAAICVPTCTSDASCRNGYRCASVMATAELAVDVCEPR